ncbi:hypothetical protein I6H46_06410 [Anaerococcus obesiensis]|nr:hypothetical protein [Anaerococcus obesiensis]QQN55543.1 hypothetical protein I6H46_06410 [Anaerococcus obesiensis]
MEIDREKINESIKGYLPNYMIPSKVYYVESIMLNSNGKIDQEKNFDIINAENNEEKVYTANNEATSETEEKILKICKNLLETEDLTLESNFYDFGADSLIIAK